MKRILLSVTLGLFVTGLAQAKTVKVDEKRLLKIIGEVRGDAIGDAQKLEQLTRKSRRPVWLLINSPGGAVVPGMIFVEAMKQAKQRGVRIKCVTGVLAASMAFIYLSHCDDRYVLSQARLLFHPISIGTQARVQELVVDLTQTIKEEKRIMVHLQKSMGLSWREFHPFYMSEVFWTAEGLEEHIGGGWLTVVDDVRGVGDDLFKWRRPTRGLFGNRNVRRVIERFLSDGQ